MLPKTYHGYQVYPNGKVWRLTQDRTRKDGVTRTMRGGWVATRVRRDYVWLDLWIAGKAEYWSLHRLLAVMFLPNPEGLTDVNHKNGLKGDNNLNNLEWVSSSENRLHAYRNGMQPYLGCSAEAATAIWKARNIDKRELKDIATQYKLSFQSISRIAKGGHHAVKSIVCS